MSAPSVEVSNETAFPVDQAAVASLVSATLDHEGASGVVVVTFLGEIPVAELNRRFRGVDGPTDVLSFPGGTDDDGWPEPEGQAAGSQLGDVIVCPQVARQNAADDAIALDVELRHVLVHGVLHLLGWDHETDHGEMRAREDEILRGLGAHPGALLVPAVPSPAEHGPQA